MKKLRFISLLLIFVLLCSCSKPETPASTDDTQQSEQTETPDTTPTTNGYKNSLTGEYELESETQVSMRPVAVAVNNIKNAQTVQTGLETADIIYETYVEGGITRLLAVYKNISKAGEIGSIRSARYDFVDLCEGHDATYIHAGIDSTYAQPYINSLGVDNANLLNGSIYKYAYRISNGLASEHTLYSKGENLAKMLAEKGWRTTVDDAHKGDWQNFSDKDLTLAGGKAMTIDVAFGSSYITKFSYNAQTGMYSKTNNPDWRTGKNIETKNVVVLFTTLGQFADGYRMKIGMQGGDGYYFVNGTYQKIKWTKGAHDASFKFTDEAGNALSYNVGNSYVCMVSNDMKGKLAIGG